MGEGMTRDGTQMAMKVNRVDVDGIKEYGTHLMTMIYAIHDDGMDGADDVSASSLRFEQVLKRRDRIRSREN